MMVKVIVRDNIIMPDIIPTDTDLEALDCYYESPVFFADGSIASFQAAIERYYEQFNK